MALVVLVVSAAQSRAQPQPPPQPFAPEWAMLSGWDVFATKGCGKCHALRGFGGNVGPDLGRIQTGKSFFDLSAAMWNHLPRMAARMREMGIERPTLTARELSDLIAFVFTAQYFDEVGNAVEGQRLWSAKGCGRCHEIGGNGGLVGPGLDFLKRANSPVIVAAALWNHAPEMADAMQATRVERPTFQRGQLVDLIAYIVAAAKDSGDRSRVQIVPGTPARGERLFVDKQCAVCHLVADMGGRIGPELGPRHHVSLTEFAALMWNHGPAMWSAMKQRGIPVPRLSGQEMADVVAHLYTSRYFDARGRPGRGGDVLKARGCLGCHSVRGNGGTSAADLTTSRAVQSPASLVAAMWNHSRSMEEQVRKQGIEWPMLSGHELSDISAYFDSLASPLPARSRRSR